MKQLASFSSEVAGFAEK